jgi:hypothetical protein
MSKWAVEVNWSTERQRYLLKKSREKLMNSAPKSEDLEAGQEIDVAEQKAVGTKNAPESPIQFARQRTVEAWCCGIAADDELGETDVRVYANEEACYEGNGCSRRDPRWCAPRKLAITFGTNWIPAADLDLAVPIEEIAMEREVTATDAASESDLRCELAMANAYAEEAEAELARLREENIRLLNDASEWRNRAIAAEEEIREGGRGIDLRRGFER